QPTTGGTTMDANVTDFKVWQDFMPIVPPSGPPLHAVVTIETTSKPGRAVVAAGGAITITRASGEIIATAPLTSTQAPDDRPMQQTGPTSTQLGTGPLPITAKLTEGEMLSGTATITISGAQVDLNLPQTALTFTH
ncbi:MAG: hypothetical protein ACJ78Q_18080, partial [Chloroflexia bacterium]